MNLDSYKKEKFSIQLISQKGTYFVCEPIVVEFVEYKVRVHELDRETNRYKFLNFEYTFHSPFYPNTQASVFFLARVRTSLFFLCLVSFKTWCVVAVNLETKHVTSVAGRPLSKLNAKKLFRPSLESVQTAEQAFTSRAAFSTVGGMGELFFNVQTEPFFQVYTKHERLKIPFFCQLNVDHELVVKVRRFAQTKFVLAEHAKLRTEGLLFEWVYKEGKESKQCAVFGNLHNFDFGKHFALCSSGEKHYFVVFNKALCTLNFFLLKKKAKVLKVIDLFEVLSHSVVGAVVKDSVLALRLLVKERELTTQVVTKLGKFFRCTVLLGKDKETLETTNNEELDKFLKTLLPNCEMSNIFKTKTIKNAVAANKSLFLDFWDSSQEERLLDKLSVLNENDLSIDPQTIHPQETKIDKTTNFFKKRLEETITVEIIFQKYFFNKGTDVCFELSQEKHLVFLVEHFLKDGFSEETILSFLNEKCSVLVFEKIRNDLVVETVPVGSVLLSPLSDLRCPCKPNEQLFCSLTCVEIYRYSILLPTLLMFVPAKLARVSFPPQKVFDTEEVDFSQLLDNRKLKRATKNASLKTKGVKSVLQVNLESDEIINYFLH